MITLLPKGILGEEAVSFLGIEPKKPKDLGRPGNNLPTNAQSGESESDSFIRQDHRLFDKYSVIIMLLGIVAFVGGASIDLATPKYPEIANVIENCAPPKGMECESAVRIFDRKSHAVSEFTWWGLLAEAAQAIGLTMLAAVFIASTVDRRTRSYFFRQLSRKTERLGSNVLLGMFEARHNPRMFDLVRRHIFEKKVIRRNIDITYTLVDLDADLSKTRLAGESYLKLDVILSTVYENINVAEAGTKGMVEFPVSLGLPNPLLDELKPFVRVNSWRIGDNVLDAKRLAEINKELQEKLKDDTLVDATVPIGSCKLLPGDMATVSGSYTMVKEGQDTEVFRSKEIAENLHVTVVNKTSLDLQIRARSLAHGPLHEQLSPSAQQWKLDELSLPLQGIMVWWKKAPKDPPPLKPA